ncbi:hypothetical protein, unlikely [Trypanosoma brucei gambiense DAL972]|uniref:Uncharacterized protein n=1 Tax=Trypanosoma brucei gambiense (strain MHOM/CI/86/DAL972) TaxID=679716 RepID=C9ZSC6_TRYB9|nr:hypothetical protein, unlikely [Trypanosoma brucei gambiense DAL972]CBH12264.1 hypothetical protein, unlikely [Trypanosoma brucei gambiense DAL972]|eukprot:XP_011774545.1 hypothetical protein, unlikely [Trypanosoma brucei gambiense DAL972]
MKCVFNFLFFPLSPASQHSSLSLSFSPTHLDLLKFFFFLNPAHSSFSNFGYLFITQWFPSASPRLPNLWPQLLLLFIYRNGGLKQIKQKPTKGTMPPKTGWRYHSEGKKKKY